MNTAIQAVVSMVIVAALLPGPNRKDFQTTHESPWTKAGNSST
jgi:hypothetical protein